LEALPPITFGGKLQAGVVPAGRQGGQPLRPVGARNFHRRAGGSGRRHTRDGRDELLPKQWTSSPRPRSDAGPMIVKETFIPRAGTREDECLAEIGMGMVAMFDR
jgi:hypothetical protein